MVGNGRFDLASAIPGSSSARNHCKRGGYLAPNLDRCVSFREGSDGRILNSCKAMSRGSSVSAGDAPSLSKSIKLEPIVMDRGNARSVVLKSILGLSAGGSSSEEKSACLRSSPPVATEDLRRFRASVAETCVKARGRATNLVEHLDQLNKYSEARSLQKQQQSDLLTNERTGGYNVKMGNQISQSPLDPGNHKLEDRPKNVILNRRLRTSVSETRAEGRNCGLMKHPLVMPKDRDTNSADSDVAVDKNSSLPAGGEVWDKKMKRKRSVGPVCPRPDGEGEAKRAMHPKVSSEPSMESSDSQTFGPGSNDLCGRVSKMDGTLSLGNSGYRATPKIEQEKAFLSTEKAQRFSKGNIKLNNPEENDVPCPSPATTKGKVSRASRSSTAARNFVANALLVSGTLEGWELPQSMNRNVSISGADTRKRATTLSPCSSPITHWGGQRPPKNSRTRRANIVSPVSNHDEAHTPTEGFSPSDSSARSQASGANKSILFKGMSNGLQSTKANPKIAVSPARLSDSEESGPGENRLQGNIVGNGLGENAVNAIQSVGSPVIQSVGSPVIQSVGSPAMLMKKRKLLVKEESSDGLQRQGRNETNSVSRDRIAPAGDKSDNAALTKPFQSVTDGSDRNGSKSGRPQKKLSDRKDVARMGNSSGGSLDFTGEQDDDREDIIAAANLAQSHSVLASKDGIWRPAEPLFASISTEKKSYLLQERKRAEEVQQSLSRTPGCCTKSQDDYVHEVSLPDAPSVRFRNAQSKTEPKDITSPIEPVDQGKCSSSSGGRKVKSLYQRVLAALIMEDDIEDYDQNGCDGFLLPHADLDLPDYARLLVNGDGSTADGMELYYKSVFGRQTLSNGFVDGLCHTNSITGRRPTFQVSPCYGGTLRRENWCLNSETQASHGNSSLDGPYDQLSIEAKLLLELHSIGLYPEMVPDLHDKEDYLNEESIRLKSGLHQQAGKKKEHLDNILDALEKGKDVEGHDMEQVAMDKLVEIANKKLLSTRNRASKHGTAKLSKQVAVGFAKRTVGRCKKFEESGVSCFSEPPQRDIIHAPPPRVDEVDPLIGFAGLGIFINSSTPGNNTAKGDGSEMSRQAFAKSGLLLNRGKKNEVLLDDVGNGASNRTPPLDTSVKWKRSERDNSKHNASSRGRGSLGNISRGERKLKSKPKQKTADDVKFFFSGGGGGGGSGELSGGSGREVVGGVVPLESSKEVKESGHVSNTPINVIESIDGLDEEVAGIGEGQDLCSWLSEVDALQDIEQTDGLSIPMDDISQLFF